MLTPEQAQKTLEQFRIPGWRARTAARLKRVPEPAREAGRFLVGNSDDDDLAFQPLLARAGRQLNQVLDALDDLHRHELFDALFPKLAPHVERSWRLHYSLPYQPLWYRRPYRAPHSPAVSSERRANWLCEVFAATRHYDADIAWVAAWAPYLENHYFPTAGIGLLLAAAIDAGGASGDEVFEILCASARGEHPTGGMGHHVISALLTASRPEGWEVIEKLLLAAQRQEGLRQAILETVDEAHPGAFRRILRTILEHDLVRFSAVVRAADVWFGLLWDSASAKTVSGVLERALKFLEDPQAREMALRRGNGESVYLALWTFAFESVEQATARAAELLGDSNAERRFAAVHLLAQLGLDRSQEALLIALDDKDLRVAARALQAFEHEVAERVQKTDAFERLTRLAERCPKKKKTYKPILFPWCRLSLGPPSASRALAHTLGKRPLMEVRPLLSHMAPRERADVAERAAKADLRDAGARDLLFALVADSSQDVREKALAGLARYKLTSAEMSLLEGMLTRAAADLRRGVMGVLLNQSDAAALGSARRLLTNGEPAQRLAGLEMLRLMRDTGRCADECREAAEQYRVKARRVSEDESSHLKALEGNRTQVATLDDCLGLIEPAQRTRPRLPRSRDIEMVSDAAIACIRSLNELVHKHGRTPISVEREESRDEGLLADSEWYFPSPDSSLDPDKDWSNLPLRRVWEEWWVGRPAAMRDGDGLELMRVLGVVYDDWEYVVPEHWARCKSVRSVLLGDRKLRLPPYRTIIENTVWWLTRRHAPRNAVSFLLDALDTSFAAVPTDELSRSCDPDDYENSDWRGYGSPFLLWLSIARRFRMLCPQLWSAQHHVRLFELLRWKDEPGTEVPRDRPELDEVIAAYRAGGANEADLLDQLLGPRAKGRYRGHFGDLYGLSAHKPAPELKELPVLAELVERCRHRILDVELNRGDTPTAASSPALSVRSSVGVATLVRLLTALGKAALVRGLTRGDESKPAVLSHLIQVTFPGDSDTPQEFAARVLAADMSPQRLVELAVHAPQWAAWSEYALKWPGLADGVWWLHAHTKDRQWRVDEEVRENWQGQISERTPLSGNDLLDGAVDVEWFKKAADALGKQRWAELDRAAKLACGGTGHARAKLFANAMLGEVARREIIQRITKKRHQDSVRALGLLPLAKGNSRQKDLLERYQIMQEFLRTGRQFGAQRRASEKRAVEIGMENLARTAGYRDPLRLQWAMEMAAAADLAEGPVGVTVKEVSVSLSVDDQGQPEIAILKSGKPLKAVPTALREDKRIAELLERKTELKRQAARMRGALEQAMCRGNEFGGAELQELFGHPLLAPLLSRLVLIGAGITGYPIERGRVLQDHAGRREPVRKNERVRIAHPHDLLESKAWHLWQRECFAAERIQPFKQVFRELYVLTDAERGDGNMSQRFAGQQVHPRQALALLGTRGWVHRPEEGVHHIFHDLDLTARLKFENYFITPAEVEGLTVRGVQFTRRGEFNAMPLPEITPRIFSEVMRDVDLVVSVAHRGGVDPEASTSTVEMRAALLFETIAALKLCNVRVNERHALIDGQLGQYSVHLGSAVVHRMPGGALCIVPVHAQHRGRLFLPFADHDPKTAEVLSKVLLLARDSEIKDPSILSQLRA